jgi:hypothetical protein
VLTNVFSDPNTKRLVIGIHIRIFLIRLQSDSKVFKLILPFGGGCASNVFIIGWKQEISDMGSGS